MTDLRSFHIASFSSAPALPIELVERILDHLAEAWLSSPEPYKETQIRAALRACSLVCRSWVSRCRFHLVGRVCIDSRDALEAAAAFLHSSTLHAHRVRTLHIVGGNPDQSWISILPFRLPKLPKLTGLVFSKVDFTQQHVLLPRFLSLFNSPRQTQFDLLFDDQVTDLELTRVAGLAVATQATTVGYNASFKHRILSTSDVSSLDAWPHRLRYLTVFEIDGSPDELVDILSRWAYTAQDCRIALRLSTLRDSLLQHAGSSSRVWEEITRIFLLLPESSRQPAVIIATVYAQDERKLEAELQGMEPLTMGSSFR